MYGDNTTRMTNKYLTRIKNRYLLSALVASVLGVVVLPLCLFINFIVLFRTGSLDLFCEHHGACSGNVRGSVPFDLKSYSCGGYFDVFSNFNIAFYYSTSTIMIASVLLSIYFFVMYEKCMKSAWRYHG